MSYYEDATCQLKSILNGYTNEEIKTTYKKDLEKIFLCLYAINYIQGRTEVKGNFNCDYYRISFSCLIESFSLIINNHPRAASLVLRSGLENFIKFIIFINNKKNDENYSINSRSYTANKNTLSCIIDKKYSAFFRDETNSLNSKMEAEYKKLSALSHSLVPESKDNTMKFLSEIKTLNKKNTEVVLEKIKKVELYIFSFCIILCKTSLKNWQSDELGKILRLVFGKPRTKTFLKNIKL